MTSLVVHPARGPLRGVIPACPDRDVAEMALFVASLARPGETSTIRTRGIGVLPIVEALGALGVDIGITDEALCVTGVGLAGFCPPTTPIDAGDSATALALVAGLLSALPFPSEVHCAEPIGRSHLQEVTRVLRLRGAQLEARFVIETPGALLPPLHVQGASGLAGLQRHGIAPGAQAEKHAALASGLLATDSTILLESSICGDAFVRVLHDAGATVQTAGGLTRLQPLSAPVNPRAVTVPGDANINLLLLAAAMAVKDSLVGIRGVVVQPSDAGGLQVLRDSGAALEVAPRATLLGQATGDLSSRGHRPQAVNIDGEQAHAARAALPALAAWAAHARRDSVISGIVPSAAHTGQGPRIVRTLATVGVPATWNEARATLSVRGDALRRQPHATLNVDSEGDGACAMLAAVLALATDGTTRITNADGIVAVFPRFVGSLRALGAHITVEP